MVSPAVKVPVPVGTSPFHSALPFAGIATSLLQWTRHSGLLEANQVCAPVLPCRSGMSYSVPGPGLHCRVGLDAIEHSVVPADRLSPATRDRLENGVGAKGASRITREADGSKRALGTRRHRAAGPRPALNGPRGGLACSTRSAASRPPAGSPLAPCNQRFAAESVPPARRAWGKHADPGSTRRGLDSRRPLG